MNISMKKDSFDQEKGEILGSKFFVNVPKNLSGDVLIFCHGYRPKGFQIERKALYDKLLKKGWVIAALSYRREGYILEDAMDDVLNLRKHIKKRLFEAKGRQQCVFILDAQSMGGAICTLLAERFPDSFECVFGLGAALLIDPVKEKENNLKEEAITFNYEPKIPILFLMNNTEVSTVTSYQKRIKSGKYLDNVRVFYVNRPGHCEVTCSELERSFFSLLKWSRDRELHNIDPKPLDVTDYSHVVRSTCVYDVERKGMVGVVNEVSRFGSFCVSFTAADLRRLFIFKRNLFELTLLKSDKVIQVYFGDYPFVGVEFGTIVASEDVVSGLLVKNHALETKVGKVVKDYDVRIGDEVFIREKVVEIPKEKSAWVKKMLDLF